LAPAILIFGFRRLIEWVGVLNGNHAPVISTLTGDFLFEQG